MAKGNQNFAEQLKCFVSLPSDKNFHKSAIKKAISRPYSHPSRCWYIITMVEQQVERCTASPSMLLVNMEGIYRMIIEELEFDGLRGDFTLLKAALSGFYELCQAAQELPVNNPHIMSLQAVLSWLRNPGKAKAPAGLSVEGADVT